MGLTVLAILAGPTQAAGQNPQIMIRAEFIAIPKPVFDDAMRDTPHQLPSADLILGFKQSGQATVLHSPTIVTQPGLEATVRAVREVIYPTDIEVVRHPPTNSVDGEMSVVVVRPACHETREVGAIFTVLPELSRETDDILLTFAPELVSLTEWKKHTAQYTDAAGNAKTVEMDVPLFYARSISTTVRLKNGTTVMAGAGMNDESNKNVTFILVTAQLIDSTEKPVNQTVEEPNRTRHW